MSEHNPDAFHAPGPGKGGGWTAAVFDRPGHLLLVGFDAVGAEMIQRGLDTLGHRLDWIRDGYEALAWSHAHVPDMVMLDITTLGQDGVDLCVQLKEDPRYQFIPIVAAVQDPTEAECLKVYESGICDLMIKPFSLKLLRARVQMHLRSRRAMTALHWAQKRLTLRIEGQSRDLAEISQALQDRMSDKHVMQQALLDTHAKFEQLVGAIPSILIALELDLRVTHWNGRAEEVLGVAASMIIGSRLDECLIPWDDHMILEALEGCREDGQERQLNDMGFIRVNGESGQLGLTLSPIRGYGSRIVGYLIYGADITQRKQMEQHYNQAQKMEAIGRLAVGIAHDFNNALTVILGHCDLLNSGRVPMEAAPHNIGEIRNCAQRASDMTQQLFAFGRKQAMKAAVLDLNELLVETKTMLRPLLGENIELAQHLVTQPLYVLADPSQLTQVILNLAINARDAMPKGGHLVLTTTLAEISGAAAAAGDKVEPGGYARFSMRDTGEGMDTATRERIFEPFFTTKPKRRGTGMGLASVYGIIRQNGGRIEVESERGVGSTFHVLLPLTAQRPAEEPLPAVEGDVPIGSESILVVEDETAICDLLREVLPSFGYDVTIVDNVGDALDLLEKGEVAQKDLLLTDLMLPRMQGDELAERMLEACPGLKVLYMSGYAPQSIKKENLVKGGSSFIHKPFSSMQLARKLRELLDTPVRTPTKV